MILDTNALSAFAEEHPGIAAIVAEAQQIALPVIVLGEFRYGIAQSRHAARYRRWLDGLLSDCAVLDVTDPTTNHYAAINIERPTRTRPPLPLTSDALTTPGSGETLSQTLVGFESLIFSMARAVNLKHNANFRLLW